jgi:hypothetical protein
MASFVVVVENGPLRAKATASAAHLRWLLCLLGQRYIVHNEFGVLLADDTGPDAGAGVGI